MVIAVSSSSVESISITSFGINGFSGKFARSIGISDEPTSSGRALGEEVGREIKESFRFLSGGEVSKCSDILRLLLKGDFFATTSASPN